jgi:excinuclease ABC subunit A
MDKPDVDFVEGLSPAISIDQKTASRNPRSTVATVTEVYDYLRLLFARAGTPHCPQCGRVVQKQSAELIVNKIMDLGEGARLHILAPLVRGRKGEYKKVFEDARKKGFARVRVNGTIYNIDETDDLKLERYEKHDIEIVVDRIVLKAEDRSRIADSIQTALKMAEGVVMVEIVVREGEKAPAEPVLTFSEAFACAYDGTSFEELEPRTFSFNSPYGACPECSGLGHHMEFDPQLCVPDTRLTLDEGAIAPWRKSNSNYKKEMMRSLGREFGFTIHDKWSDLTQHQKDVVLHGSTGQQIAISYVNMHGRRRNYKVEWEGVLASLKREYSEFGDNTKEELQKYMSEAPCHACKGARLKPWPLMTTVAGKNIAALTNIGVGEAAQFFAEMRKQSEKAVTPMDALENGMPVALTQLSEDAVGLNGQGASDAGRIPTNKPILDLGLPPQLSLREATISRPIVKEIQERLQFLVDVGLDYLTLDRTASTLSGGEAQRIRLATQIGSGLVGVLYVLDEPSIGFTSAITKN